MVPIGWLGPELPDRVIARDALVGIKMKIRYLRSRASAALSLIARPSGTPT